MNLYKCRRCKGAWAMETRVEKFWCPMCGNYVTDMSPYIEPDPQAGDGEIVKAAKDGAFFNTDKFLAFARLIEAKIEAVRKQLDSDATDLNQCFVDLQRKGEEIRTWLDGQAGPTEIKPQPFPEQSRRVARCKDEKGVEHPLIPGVSVVRGPSGKLMLFHYQKNDTNYGSLLEESTSWSIGKTLTLWLRDLPFPPEGGTE